MIESTIVTWLLPVGAEVFAVLAPQRFKGPFIAYRIENEFTPEDGFAPFGATGHRVRFSVQAESYKQASELKDELVNALVLERNGFLVSTVDRGDFYDEDVDRYDIIIDTEITVMQ